MACKCGTPGCGGPADKDFIEACIAREGWAGMGVFRDADSPGFNYTIGLAARGRPEILVFGLPPRVGHSILRAAVERIDDIRDGAVLDGIASFPSAFVSVPAGPANDRYLIQARHHFGHPVEVVQMVWPDPDGLFPWQDGCVAWMAAVQSPLIDFASRRGFVIPGAAVAGRARREMH